MKKHLFVAVVLSMVLFSCAPRVVYVDRPASNPNNYSPAPAPVPADNQAYQPPQAQPTPPPANNNQQYNNNGGQPNNNNQYNNGTQSNNGGQQDYYNNNQNSNQNYNNQNNNNQNYYQESDQQYYANQQQVNYGSSSYQTFYDELAPYGSWVNYQSYGYVWRPAQGPGFTPYSTNGYWVYTQYGMTWQSNYNWGWAPFHYGNWILDPFYGWLWVPGHTWAPAWVTWGHCNGYYGWAPIGPGVTYYQGYTPPQNHWCFVDERHVTERNVNNYVVTHDNNYVVYNTNVTNVTIVNHDQTYNNIVYNAGPHREDVEKSTGHAIQTVNITESAKPVPASQANQNNTISIYRPNITKASANTSTPKTIVPIANIKPATPHATQPQPGNNNNLGVRPNESRQPEPVRVQPAQGNQVTPGKIEPPHTIERQPEPVRVQPEPAKVQPAQTTPVQPRPIERKPEPIQRNPNPTPTVEPNQTRPVAPRPQPRPQPKPQPKPVAPKGQPEKAH